MEWAGPRGQLPDYWQVRARPAGQFAGWLLQLDGDDQRNRFLNASWVRAVMPVRPGKEEAAIAWLTKADVEGTKGLEFTYAGNAEEADEIIDGLRRTGAGAGPTHRWRRHPLPVQEGGENT